MTLREYAKLMNDTALQGSLSNEEYNRLYKPLLDGIQSMIPPMLFRYRSCNELSLQALWDDKIWLATVYKGNIIKNLIMDCQSYTKYRPNETTGGIFVSWRRKEELPTGA